MVDCEYLQSRKIRDKVPIVFCIDESNITKMESFVSPILVCIDKMQWELMDENDDEMEHMEWDGDNSIGNMVGMYIKHADKAFCDYFKTMDNCLKDVHKKALDARNDVTPCRGQLRKHAHEKLSTVAASMKKCVLEKVGEDKVCKVREVVHVPLKDVDKVKVDTGNLTGVIVQVDKSHSQAWVAVKSGLLKTWYIFHQLGCITGYGNNVELNGLSETSRNWKTLKEYRTGGAKK